MHIALSCVGFISGAFQLPHCRNNPSRFASNCQVGVVINFSRVGFGSFDATKELCIFSAGAIYVKEGSFTQLGGNLTITDASAKSDGGVVRIR